MICPHCEVSLLQKERTGYRCGKCMRPFALDPKSNPLKLHDLRVRRLLEQATDAGRVPCTHAQLYHAAARKVLKSRRDSDGVVGCALLGGAATVAATLWGLLGDTLGLLIAGGALALCTVLAVIGMLSDKGSIPTTLPDFRKNVIGRWRSVYGGPPPGLVDETTYPAVQPLPGAGAALVCPDQSVLAFLAANGVPQRLGLALSTGPAHVPDGVPVVVLHDASPDGCLLPGRIRAALPGHLVTDAGLAPRTVMAAPGALPLRGRKPKADVLRSLRGSGTLTEAELDWLGKGWSGVLAAVPPVKLLAVVERAARRAVAQTADPARRDAEHFGFLSWPGERAV